ncbi:Aste57867_15851 [Aphanomyces stellatus]|uniref:Aste57867_15851 protein n=1 Tax=Aphanomyces stellatus TaxID=120398 RepID=A0A485L549_9STRA|nr:hypothetical protein As57867_015795 [Aphanomyces stellatus]VFT92638.1 Aste57867_15851 [Aphanomyces stellatus]
MAKAYRRDDDDATACPRLPFDILVRIGLWIEDVDSIFAFLDALGTPDARGPLDSLWQLGSTTLDRNNLWPSLVLTDAMCQPGQTTLVEAALPLYSHVDVRGMLEVGWLIQHLRAPRTVTWNAAFPSSQLDAVAQGPLADWFLQWAMLPLTNVTVVNPRHGEDDAPIALTHDAAPFFFAVLPQCSLLVSLKLHCPSSIAPVFALAASSSTLISLDMEFPWDALTPALTTTDVLNATKWLRATPVRHFRFPYLNMDTAIDRAVQNAFLHTLFTCPTLRRLQCYGWDLASLDASFLPITLGMRTLSLEFAALTPVGVSTLAQALRSSATMAHLILRDVRRVGLQPPLDYTTAYEALFDAVARSNVRSLNVSGCHLGEMSWGHLGPSLQQSQLQLVTFGRNAITDDAGMWIVHAIQAHATINNVDLSGNSISAGLVEELLTHAPHRPCLWKRINVSNQQFSDQEKTCLLGLADEMDVRISI